MVRLGIVGLGNMGSGHVAGMNRIKRCELTAVCDIVPEKLERYSQFKTYTDSAEMIRSGEIDAILLAVPHYDHTTIGIDALNNGLHVLTEKPISVHKADCERLIAAHTDKSRVFAAMFNQRTDPFYKRIRAIVKNGELGEIRRTACVATNWFRTEAYYASGGWRATWAGEGGGVLLNQCPHTLDLFQWICGMPSKIRATCNFGRFHNIEVEDDVTAYLQYANGATGVFIATTGEAPGTSRLEIAGDRGRLVYEDDRITFDRTEMSVAEFCQTSSESFASPATWQCHIPEHSHGPQHIGILQNFVDAILDGSELIAPAEEGIHSVELANAMLYSTFTDSAVDLPIDSAAYEAALMEKIKTSRFKKTVRDDVVVDLSKSFH
ncbi:MAG: Gfo/Idh/MocA family oxidoreductase [Fimbriimonas sp.]|nr:Gfo/Idh/MocA family oxidoreductase [Fimbriimonas sp.]